MFTSILSFVSLGMLLIIVGLAVGIVMALAARKPGSNIVIAQGAVQKLVSIAMSGNVDALVAAAVESIHLHLAEGSLPEKLLQAGFAEVQRNVSNPDGKTPLIDAIALFSGKTRQQVFDVFKAELDGPAATPIVVAPAPTPAAAVVALLLLALAMPASGADTWGMPVKGPQRFYEQQSVLRSDPPLKRMRDGTLGDCNLPDTGPTIHLNYFYADWCKDCADSSLLADNLRRQGYDVIKRNCSSDDGAKSARAFNVKTVPFWIVMEDGRFVVTSNDSKKVLAYLNSKKALRGASPVGYWPNGPQPPEGSPVYYQPVYYTAPTQTVTFWNRGPTRRFVSAPFRWRPLRRLFGRC